LGFLLTPLAAHAQYPGGGSGGYPGGGSGGGGGAYSGPAYSSPGNCTITTPGDPQSPHVYPYALTSSGFGGGNAYSGLSNGTTSVCTGKITATFTWQPAYAGQPPPQNVIVYESASASYGGTILPKPAGTCADGLGDALVPNTSGATSSGTHYTVIAGVPTITRTVTPSANVNCNGGYSGASVSYSAAVYPVTLSLSGTTKDSSHQDNILIGQGCNGSLLAAGFTLSNFQWTISGETFANYEVSNSTVPINTTVASYGRVRYLSSDDLTSSSPHWYWKHGLSDPVNGTASGEPQTVSCTAQATDTATGLPIGTVTGQRTVSVWAPYNKFHYDLTSAPPTSYFNWGTGNVATQSTIGFDGTVGIPEFFYHAYASTGIWQFTQLCQISRVAIPSYYVVTNGYVLDAEFNYSSAQGSPWYADAVFVGNPSTNHVSSDNPQQPLAGPPEIGIDDFYWTYMMFQPPGTDVSWVPIHKMERHWQAALHSMLSIYWYPTPPGTLQVTSDAPSSEFPVWQDVYIDKNAQ